MMCNPFHKRDYFEVEGHSTAGISVTKYDEIPK